MKKKKVDALKLRKSLRLTQAQFWSRIKVTQSGGSRHENERSMPGPVRKLLSIVYLKETAKRSRSVLRSLGG
jgi:hypothetical protein